MESKVLNFPDAMRLAVVLVDHVSIIQQEEGTFLELFGELSEEEIVLSLNLLGLANENSPEDILASWITSIYKNGGLDLIDAYQTIGFRK